MKLATIKDGSRDGQLVVVSRDLSTAHYATGIANHLQHVLDDWNFISPQLQDLYDTLNSGKTRHAFPLHRNGAKVFLRFVAPDEDTPKEASNRAQEGE